MLRYLLDTNVLAEPVAKEPDKRVLRRLERHHDECATAAPVVHEIRYGIEILEPSRRRTAYERYLDDVVLSFYPVLPYDHRAAEWHAGERARQHKLGVKRPYFDGLIAAIASVNGLTVVTANLRDFNHYEGLTVETWEALTMASVGGPHAGEPPRQRGGFVGSHIRSKRRSSLRCCA